MKKISRTALFILTFLFIASINAWEYQSSASWEFHQPQFDYAQDSVYWIKTYGGPGSELAYAIDQTSDGGFIVAGNTWVFGAGVSDIWVIKLDSKGDIQWQRTYGGGNYEYSRSVYQTDDGGYIVGGETDSFGSGDDDFWLLKLRQNGSIEWQRTFGGKEHESFGALQKTADGGYVVIGHSRSFGDSNGDIWVLKLNSRGDVQWQKTYGDKVYMEYGDAISVTSNGDFIIAGSIDRGVGFWDFWIIKINGEGDIEWQRTYGGAGREAPYLSEIHQTKDGGYVVAGYTTSFGAEQNDMWILKLQKTGEIDWQKVFSGDKDDVPCSIKATDDGGCIVVGTTGSSPFGGNSDVLVIKLKSNGNIDWHKKYGTIRAEEGHDIQSTIDGGYVVAGFTGSPLIGSDSNWFIFKMSSNGEIGPCPLVSDSDVTVSNTSATMTETYIAPIETNIEPLETNISPNDSAAETILLCWNLCQPPENITLINEINRSLFRKETYHKLSWSPHPYNDQFIITEYRIYTEYAGNYELIGSISGNTYEYLVGPYLEDEQVKYVITSVDSEGIESPKSQTVKS